MSTAALLAKLRYGQTRVPSRRSLFHFLHTDRWTIDLTGDDIDTLITALESHDRLTQKLEELRKLKDA